MELKGKTVLFLGSSVTYGSAAGGVSFADFLAEECGIKSIKEAVSGTTLVDINELSYISRLKNVDENERVDLFICQLSTNDAGQGLPLAKIEAAIRFIINYVREKFNCPIAFYTNPYFNNKNYKAMVDMLRNLAVELKFDILNFFDDEEMKTVSKEDYKEFMADHIHPTLKGYKEWWTPKFISFLNNI